MFRQHHYTAAFYAKGVTYHQHWEQSQREKKYQRTTSQLCAEMWAAAHRDNLLGSIAALQQENIILPIVSNQKTVIIPCVAGT